MAEGKQDNKIARILIVDDVDTNRFILRDIIAGMGYIPVLTENGAQALKMLPHIKPQLIILDIAMPGMDGYEVCEKIKTNPDTEDIPIIFISAYDEPEDVVKGFSVGGSDYITKPFIPEVVRARVRMHLDLYETNLSMQEMNRRLQMSVEDQRKQMERERQSVLYALIRVARANASYDEMNMERLKHNCRILAEAMQLSVTYEHRISDKYVDMIELAAPLCDLGNLAIPTSILQKTDRLTDEENAVMRTHTTIGAQILQDVAQVGRDNGFIHMAIEIVHYHHENWDGTGYPEQISGDEIPLSAQIVAVASTYCALTEARAYREAFSREKAMEIMQEDAGKKFNPEIFKILRKIVRQLR